MGSSSVSIPKLSKGLSKVWCPFGTPKWFRPREKQKDMTEHTAKSAASQLGDQKGECCEKKSVEMKGTQSWARERCFLRSPANMFKSFR